MKTRITILMAVLVIMAMACNQQSPVQADQSQETSDTIQAPDYQKMITARMFIKAGREADFIEAAKMMIDSVKGEEGCLSYMMYQDPYEKTNFIFVEKYTNQAAVDFHLGTSYFKAFSEKTADMTSKPADVKILDIAGEK
jgi:quinol monooxygenase YgiN